ncbi:MAG: hypothetical protein E6G62_09185 [Actinobacteria bacterium]|nr:MAG: hypothetical protein E6G62_09185 [Actinomycetota bacterium]
MSVTTVAFANGSAGVLVPDTVTTFVCESAITGTRCETRCVTVFDPAAGGVLMCSGELAAIRGGACTFGMAKLGKRRSGICSATVPVVGTRSAAIVGAA